MRQPLAKSLRESDELGRLLDRPHVRDGGSDDPPEPDTVIIRVVVAEPEPEKKPSWIWFVVGAILGVTVA